MTEDELNAWHKKEAIRVALGNPDCPGNDPYCPCQDGDACHYKPLPALVALDAPVVSED
jgi:hypothetical protein